MQKKKVSIRYWNFVKPRHQGKIRKLYVMGCLSERYLSELAQEIPQVDRYYGKFDWGKLVEDLGHGIS